MRDMLKTRGRWVWLVGLATCVACGGSTGSPEEETASPDEPVAASTSINDRFAGTWELVAVERFDEDDQLLPPADPPGFGREGTTGYITYDRAGYMGVVIMMPDRLPYSEDGPTADEARRSMSDYISYFGPYTVNETEGIITHQVRGRRNPNGVGDNLRAYEFHDDQLTLRPPRNDSGVQSALTWRRVPDADLSAAQQEFVGFWRIQSVERRDAAGEPQETRQWANGYIIYTAAGHMQVHLERPDRPRYASVPPTDEEVLSAVRSYTSYFGPFSVDDTQQLVTHERVGSTTPSDGRPVPFIRSYEFRDDLLILSPVPAPDDASGARTYLSWERIGGD